MVESQKFRLLVDLSDLRNHDPDLAARCLVRPIGYILAFEQALKRVTVEGVLGLFVFTFALRNPSFGYAQRYYAILTGF